LILFSFSAGFSLLASFCSCLLYVFAPSMKITFPFLERMELYVTFLIHRPTFSFPPSAPLSSAWLLSLLSFVGSISSVCLLHNFSHPSIIFLYPPPPGVNLLVPLVHSLSIYEDFPRRFLLTFSLRLPNFSTFLLSFVPSSQS